MVRGKPVIGVPQVFVASSLEGQPIARRISDAIEAAGALPVGWWDKRVFRPGDVTLPRLLDLTKQVTFAVVVLTPDDLVMRRATRQRMPRDNTVFEAGLFVGTVGPERTFLVHPETLAVALPTDLLGVTTIRYRIDARGRIHLKSANDKIRDAIERLGKVTSLTFVVDVPSGEPEGLQVGIAGTFDELAGSLPRWEACEMRLRDDGRWTFPVSGPEWHEIAYKYMLGPPWDWSHAETWADGSYRADRGAALHGDEPTRHDQVEAWLGIE